MNNDCDEIIYETILMPLFDKINKNNIFYISNVSYKKSKSKKEKKQGMSKSETIKLQHSIQKLNDDEHIKETIIEFVILDYLRKISKIIKKYDEKNEYMHHKSFGLYIYNIYKLMNEHKNQMNSIFLHICESIIEKFIHHIDYKAY